MRRRPRRTSKGRVPSPEVAELLAQARRDYLEAAELRRNMPTPLGFEPSAEADPGGTREQ